MQRYFALSVDDKQIYLESGDVFHLSKVMRANIGTKLIAIKDKPYLGEVKTFSFLHFCNCNEEK